MPDNPLLPNGHVAWYVTGRFYTDAKGNSFDAGYFPEITGIKGSFFVPRDTPGEGSAYFTFSADPFSSTALSNGDVSIGVYPPGKWQLYLNPSPGGDFSKPESFAKGTCVATFERVGTTSGFGIGSTSVSVLTFQLAASTPFEFEGKTYNFADLVPNGVTQIGYGSGALQPGLPKFPEVKCFGATATAIT